MASGTDIQHKRKESNFVPGDLGPGEFGIQTATNRVWYSADGIGVTDLAAAFAGVTPAAGVYNFSHGSDANAARPAVPPGWIVMWIGPVAPLNKQIGDLHLKPAS